MSDIVIQPSILPGEKRLYGSCLYCLTPYEVGILKRSYPADRVEPLFLFQSNLCKVTSTPNAFYWAGPAIGAPMAVMTMEKLIARGLKRFIAVGWCGSLVENVETTDLVIPAWGISEEGTSGHYLGGRRCHLPGFFREKVAEYLADCGFVIHQSPVWTTDALYRESWSKVKRFGRQGVVAVDMEFTALARLAAFRGIELAVVLLVSDVIRGGESIPAYKGKVFKKKSRTLVGSLAALLSGRYCHPTTGKRSI